MKRFVLCGMWSLFISMGGYADETAQQARAILAEHGKKVVVVQLVIKDTVSYGESFDYEYTQETFGTVISPDGLIVCSLFATDPSMMMQQMGDFGEGEMEFQSETIVTGIKILFDDNLEKEAQIVLRDKDLDLAFIRLKAKPEAPLPYIDLNAAEKVDLFDEVLYINRLGKVAKRTPSALFSRILGIVEKPRLLYFIDALSGNGEAVFNMEGKFLGVLLTRMIAAGGQAYEGPEMTGVVIPAAAVLEVAAQAPTIENAATAVEKLNNEEKATVDKDEAPDEPGAKPTDE